MKKSYIIILLLINLLHLHINAAPIQFRSFTTDEGLSHNSVISIYQDELGLMWFGTRDGLNVYDGREFTVYKYIKDNHNSILDNEINQITGDHKGKIFIMMNNGISEYDTQKGIFSTIINRRVDALNFDKELYFASENRIYKYKPDSISLIYELPVQTNITNFQWQGDSLWIGTYTEGLFLLDNNKNLSHPIPHGRIYSTLLDSENCLWVTTHDGQGLFAFNNVNSKVFRYNSSDPYSISSDQTHVCCEDASGNIWVGTFDGLNMYNKKTGKFTRYYHNQNKKSLSESSVWSLYSDRQGNIWAGTYYGGVNLFNPIKQTYYTYYASTIEPEGLSSPTVGEMTEDDKGNLWICTEGGGVSSFNLNSGKFKWYKHSNASNSISHNHAKSLYYDKGREVLWIGTHLGGLNKLNLKSGRFTHYTYNKEDIHSIPSNIVMDIIPYDNRLLLATVGEIAFFNPDTGESRPFFNDKAHRDMTSFIAFLHMDSNGILWMSGYKNGLYSYDARTQKMKSYQYNPQDKNGICNNRINYIYEDSDKSLWFSTNGGGLMRYDSSNGIFKCFDMGNSGLSSNVIYAIGELGDKRIIVTTDNGFSIMDKEEEHFVNYDRNEEIPMTSINENSFYRTSEGELFIGGMNGMLSLNEKDITILPKQYSIFPSRLTINGKEVKAGDKTGLLDNDISCTDRITIPSKYSILSLRYAVTDYLPFGKDEIMYKMEGFSDEWLKLSPDRRITYTSLPYGDYTLVVKSINKERKEIQESRLQITILPPIYRTWWAYIIYFMVISGICIHLLKTYTSRLRLRESLKYERKHTKEVEELNKMKLRFFTNISHEFRTPLAIIIGQIEVLLENRNMDRPVYYSLSRVYKNCIQLKELISELLDFRKVSQGFMSLRVRENNIVEFLREHHDLFTDYAHRRNVTFSFVATKDDIKVWFDKNMMVKVMNNLLFNAFKYTPEGGKITLSVYKTNDEAIIEVSDNGIGIKPENINNIFTRFYKCDNDEGMQDSGTGIGLALTKSIIDLHHGTIEVYSEPGNDTTFRIHMKLGNTHFNESDIDTTSIIDKSAAMGMEYPEWTKEIFNDTDETSDDTVASDISSNSKHKSADENYKMLIVEDEADLRQMLVELFSPFYTVYEANNGDEAWEILSGELPDIVVSDIVMPSGMDGIKLCEKIKSNINTCHIPVVLLTARTATEQKEDGLQSGADEYIPKPFDVKMLLLRCNNIVNNRILLKKKFQGAQQFSSKPIANTVENKAFIDKAYSIVKKSMGDSNFNIDMFASEMGMSRTKLFTCMKSILNQTPMEFVTDLRMQEAAALLRNNPELQVNEISDRLGFSSPKYFRKYFKEKYNTTPLEYRKGDLR